MVFLTTSRANEPWRTAILPAVFFPHYKFELFSLVLGDHRLVQNLLVSYVWFGFSYSIVICFNTQNLQLIEGFIFLLASHVLLTRFPPKLSDSSHGPGDNLHFTPEPQLHFT